MFIICPQFSRVNIETYLKNWCISNSSYLSNTAMFHWTIIFGQKTFETHHLTKNGRLPTWMFPKIVVPPKSSILIGFSIINHPFWGTPIFGNTHITIRKPSSQKKTPQSHRVTMPMTKSSVEWCSASSWYFFTASASGSWVGKKASET